MFMRAIRANTKWIMIVMAVAFAAWLAFEGLQQRDQANVTGVNPVVATVNGHQIRNLRWNQALTVALDEARIRAARPLTDEERRQVEQAAWDGLIQDILVEQEIERLGIEVSEAEIRQAFRTSPPPDLVRHPAFQTDGEFDYAKYQAFFADPTVDEQLLLQIESYYRQTLPRTRLARQLSGGTAISDGEVWQAYRDRNETATVSYVAVRPTDIVPDSAIAVSEDEARRWYREHRDEFARPATATVNLVTFATTPSAADTAWARERADSLRSLVVEGEATFAELAEEASADSLSAADGGRIGWFGPGDLIEPVAEAVRDLGEGDISAPVAAPPGFRLLRVDERAGDSLSLSHIVVPVVLSERGEDDLFSRMDEFEGLALRIGVAAAADTLGLPVRRGVVLTEGFDFVPGAGSLGVAVDWALDENNLLEEASEYFENGSGFHMVEVLSRTEAGIFPFEEVRSRIETTLRDRKRWERAKEVVAERAGGGVEADSLEAVAQALGSGVRQAGPFTRGQFVPELGQGTEAVGAAFGGRPGDVVGPFEAEDALVVLRVDRRTSPDEEAFLVAREQIRGQLEVQRAQAAVTRWIEGLRRNAEIVDQRSLLAAAAAAGSNSPF
ncbi:MAG: peptidyl-prolyl cis-trans isomerase [Gemmatimonadota bacterium]|nr:peptidyl-prolyl cis-trans isomerase [Gemmatimonadota bacterium]